MAQPIFMDGIGYEGKVKLTLKSNGRILSTNTYKNNGTSQLFSFLGHCLIGSYTEAEKRLLPSKIMLLKNQSDGAINSTNVIAMSSFVGLAKIPTITNNSNEVVVTYSFEVPRMAIEGSFNQVALYGAGITDSEIDKFSAFYNLVDVDGNITLQDPAGWSSTTILLIEWELSLSNKSVDIRDTNEEEDAE